MTDKAEFARAWPNLVGAALGTGTGVSLNYFTMSAFGPALVHDLHWSKADFALLGSLPLLTMVFMPFAGRFTDRFGPRIAGSMGFVIVPACFFGMAMMKGRFVEFLVLNGIQTCLGVLTTALVFSRVVIARFDRARGLALSIMMSGSPLCGAIAAAAVGPIIAHIGWRAGFLVLAGISAVGGAVVLMLIERRRPGDNDIAARPAAQPAAPAAVPPERLGRGELVRLFTHPVFLLLVAGMFLVNLPQVFATSQLKLVVLHDGVPDGVGTLRVSLYAVGTMAGRLACGVALDRVRPHVVALVSLGVPVAGYLVFASGTTTPALLIAAVLTIGLAQGAEGDVGAFILSRTFALRNFSLLYSSFQMMVGAGTAIGALVLNRTLVATGDYTIFLLAGAGTTLAGAACFGLSGIAGGRRGEPGNAATPPAGGR